MVLLCGQEVRLRDLSNGLQRLQKLQSDLDLTESTHAETRCTPSPLQMSPAMVAQVFSLLIPRTYLRALGLQDL